MGEVQFPNEIWLKIFKYIEQQKLMELRLVCHYFYDLIEDHLKKKWEQMVNDTIVFEFRTLIMQRAHPYQLVTFFRDITDVAMWRRTYMSYKKWQKTLVYSETIDTIDPESALGNISCVCTFDKYIAIAFSNGTIANYTIDNLTEPFYTTFQNNGEVLNVTVDEYHVLRFWDFENKVMISTKDLFANSISGGECRHFCIGEMDGILTSYEKEGNHITPGPTLDLGLRGGSRLIAHIFDGRNIKALKYVEDSTKIYLYQGIIEGGKLTKFVYHSYIEYATDLLGTSEYFDLTSDKLAMAIIIFFFEIGETSIGSTISYEKECYECGLNEHFGCHVRSIALHAHILIFGLEDGSVHLLYINNCIDVMNLEETIKKSRKIQVDNVPIVDITILEVDMKPYIVAITEQKVHLLNFF